MLGALSGDSRGAVGDPDDVASEIPQDVHVGIMLASCWEMRLGVGDCAKPARGQEP